MKQEEVEGTGRVDMRQEEVEGTGRVDMRQDKRSDREGGHETGRGRTGRWT